MTRNEMLDRLDTILETLETPASEASTRGVVVELTKLLIEIIETGPNADGTEELSEDEGSGSSVS